MKTYKSSFIVWSAFRHGSLTAVRVRASRRSSSGVVVACGFRSWSSASKFAGRVAGRKVRYVGGLWVVAVPVVGCVPFGGSGFGPSGWWVRGGVRGCAIVAHSVSVCLL